MSNRRLDKVNELLKREICSYVQREFAWPGTIVSVLGVDVTDDLREANVRIGVVGRQGAAGVVKKLMRKHGEIQRAVSRRVILRRTPRLIFRHDDTARRGVETVNLLDNIEKNLPKAPPEEDALSSC